MKLNINGEDLELVYSFRSAVFFEQIANKNVDFEHFTANDLITLFYCVVIASLQKAKKPIINMLDFMDAIDENGGEKCMLDFSNWYIEIIRAQYDAFNSTVDDKEVKEKPKGKKKQN